MIWQAEAQRERETHAALLELKEAHVQQLTQRLARRDATASTTKGGGGSGSGSGNSGGGEAYDDSFEEVLRDELRAMKAAYELKLTKAREECARVALDANQAQRKLVDKFSGEQRMLEAKLRQFTSAK